MLRVRTCEPRTHMYTYIHIAYIYRRILLITT